MQHISRPRRLSLTSLIAAVVLALILPTVAASEGNRQLEFGVRMAKRGLWSEALFRFERALREDPGNSRILNNLAVANEAVGNFEKALELYQQAVKIDPANADLKRNYARFVEFYQSFRPQEQEREDTGEAEEEAVEQPPSPPPGGADGAG